MCTPSTDKWKRTDIGWVDPHTDTAIRWEESATGAGGYGDGYGYATDGHTRLPKREAGV